MKREKLRCNLTFANFVAVIILCTFHLFFGCDKKSTTEGTAPATLIDIDGNIYQTVRIGNQVWMAENLRVTHYRNGDSIPNVTDNSEWLNLSSGAYCACNFDESNTVIYGYLYNWYAVNDNRNISPEGWHVPTDVEWKELEMFLGMSQSEADTKGLRGSDEGTKLKARNGWGSEGNGTNESGFSALPGGFVYGGNLSYLGTNAAFWSSSKSDSSDGWYRALKSSYSGIHRSDDLEILIGLSINDIQAGFSIRLVQD